MEDTKRLKRTLTQIVEKFVDASTQFENKLATEAQLKKSATKSIARLMTLKEVEGVAVDSLIEDFTAILRKEDDEIPEAINTVCGNLYTFINSIQVD